MALTNFGLLTDEQKTVWSMDFWEQSRNMSFIGKFLGADQNAMIQHITELKKDEKGARAVITLLADLEGDGVAGDRTLEGNEESMKSYDQVIRVDQLRHANRHEGAMADQKSIVNFRKASRNTLAYWMADRQDQLAFLTMAGISYAMKNNGAARVGSDLPNLEFAADVSAPTSGRRLRWDTSANALVPSAATTDIEVGDTPSYKMMVALKAYARTNYIRGIKGEGNSETYNVFMTPAGVAALKNDPDYIANLRSAGQRGDGNQLFNGAVANVDGLMIHEFRHVPNTAGAASGSKFGSSGTIDGQYVLLCGAQALGMADIGAPVWNEKEFDYDNQPGIKVGKIFGFLKPKFYSIYEQSVQDFGCLTCYTAV